MSCRERGSVSEVLCESHWSGVKSGRAGLEQTVADWLWSAGHLSCALKAGGGSRYLLTDGARPAEIDMTGFPFLDEQLSFSFSISFHLFALPSKRLSLITTKLFFCNTQALIYPLSLICTQTCDRNFLYAHQSTLFRVHSATAKNLFTFQMSKAWGSALFKAITEHDLCFKGKHTGKNNSLKTQGESLPSHSVHQPGLLRSSNFVT